MIEGFSYVLRQAVRLKEKPGKTWNALHIELLLTRRGGIEKKSGWEELRESKAHGNFLYRGFIARHI